MPRQRGAVSLLISQAPRNTRARRTREKYRGRMSNAVKIAFTNAPL